MTQKALLYRHLVQNLNKKAKNTVYCSGCVCTSQRSFLLTTPQLVEWSKALFCHSGRKGPEAGFLVWLGYVLVLNYVPFR
jgi:hypothetical protein